MKKLCVRAALAAALVSGPVSADGTQPVLIESNNTAGIFDGWLQSNEGQEYVIQAALEVESLDAAGVNCQGSACPDPELFRHKFAISGVHSLVDGMLPQLLEAFNKKNSLDTYFVPMDENLVAAAVVFNDAGQLVADVSLNSHSTAEGFLDLANDRASLALVSRMTSSHVANQPFDVAAKAYSEKDSHVVLGVDGLAVLVSPDNAISELTIADIAAVFAGEITNWSDLGGPDAPITVFRLGENTAETDVFDSDIFMGKKDFAQTAVVVDQNGTISDLVASNRYAIGYSSYTETGAAATLGIESECGLVSRPTDFSILSEEYPLTHRLYAFRQPGIIPIFAQEFMRFLETEDAQAAIEAAGFVGNSLKIGDKDMNNCRLANTITAAVQNPGVRMADLGRFTEILSDATRVSATFRFDKGAKTVGQGGVDEIQRLLDGLANMNLANAELLFVGFTDDFGTSSVNTSLSKNRAQQIINQVRAADSNNLLENAILTPVGMGELSPLACNDTKQHRFLNRRVEVWIRQNG